MDKFEPKETGLKRTVWLFEREILVNLEKTDLKDHHKVLTFNIFKMEYELKSKFDNGRADAIVMRNTANHWLKMWFVAFQTCASEKIQSRQAEFDSMTEALLNQTQLLAKQKVEIEEKDKRIESQSNCIGNLVVQKSVYLDKVTKAIAHLDSFDHSKACINKLQRSIECALEALRGEHANS